MSEEQKTVGITCNDYKLEKFKQELLAAGFVYFTVEPLKKDVSVIKVTCFASDFFALGKICKEVEDHFAAMKN